MAPIRIAFIGLSKTPGWSSQAHLPYLQQSSKYEIVGICNSSKESSEAAVKAYGLPASTKAYGGPDEMANDSDSFDLAVCVVRVDKHHAAIKPIVLKGKQCYVEWPLTKDLTEAEDLYSALTSSARGSGGLTRTMVGLQGRATPVVHKIKSLLSSGIIGRVASSSVLSSAGNVGPVDPQWPGEVLNDSRFGANMLSVHFGHVVDYVLFAHGQELKTLSATLSTQFPKPGLKQHDGTVKVGERDTPDQILLQGTLSGGAVLNIHQRGGEHFKGEPGLVWRIFGEKAEVEVTAFGPFLQIGYDDMKIRVHDHATGEVRTVELGEDEYAHLPQPARNVARIYEAFADGRKENYADWEDAVARHRLQEKIVESAAKGVSVSL